MKNLHQEHFFFQIQKTEKKKKSLYNFNESRSNAIKPPMFAFICLFAKNSSGRRLQPSAAFAAGFALNH